MATTAGKTAEAKDQRLNIRASGSEKEILERAARATRMGISQFMLRAALTSAEEVLADQTRFTLPEKEWNEFVALLDRPARDLPALREAAARPSPFREP